MRRHSETAWGIASLYSQVLASETRELANHIDVALATARNEVLEVLKAEIQSFGLVTSCANESAEWCRGYDTAVEEMADAIDDFKKGGV